MIENPKAASLMTIRRLPTYLRLLQILDASGRQFVSTTHLSEDLGYQPEQIRKDLAVTGIIGKPKAGYYVPALIKAILEFLRWDNTTDAFLVGTGNLGSALLGYEGFEHHGLNIVAAFDSDDDKVGTVIHGFQVIEMSRFTDLVHRMHIRMGIIAVPATVAQEVADVMVASGIVGIWNFAPVALQVPEGVIVQNEDLSSGLAVLSVKLGRLLDPAKISESAVEELA
ncbi:MAG TPA: redox-sensing transcriptional repressor Rex [Armatimonadota bacterium]|jgi:redox-sensing transcriptional repressor